MELENRSVRQLRADLISSEKSLAQFSDLLDSSFSVPEGRRFFDDFPVWSERYGVYPLLRIGVFEGQNLVSAAAVRMASLKTPVHGSTVSVALIGAVATDPKWRGMGLASRTVEMAVQWAAERGAFLVLLWSSEEKLYRKLGFEPCGQQVRVPLKKCNFQTSSKLLTPESAATHEPSSLGTIHEGWNPCLFKMLQQRKTGLVLTDKDRSWFEGHRNVRWLYTGTPEEPKAYVALNRGIDLQGVIHEWGGDREGLFSLLQSLHKEDPELSLLCSPSLHASELFTEIREVTVAKTEPLCWAKILDPSRLIASFYPSLSSEGSIQIRIKPPTPSTGAEPPSPQWRTESSKDGLWTLSIGNQTSGPHTGPELAKLILGSPLSEERRRASLFPVPLWIWGLDAA